MIKIFRHIRQQMIKENKVFKYALYAIGEILLVVIGILIALQINNNNEAKKSRAFEVKMLKEVRYELIKDTIYFNMIKDRAVRALKGTQKMMQLYAETRPNPDSLSKYGPIMSMGFQYIYHKGAYEAIKSTGIDRVSNDSVRLMLTDMYDFRLPRAQNFIEANNSYIKGFVNQLNVLTDITIVKSDTGQAKINITPKQSFMGNTQVASLIFEKMSDNSEAVNRLDNLVQACEELLKLLDRELEIEDVLEGIPENNWGKS